MTPYSDGGFGHFDLCLLSRSTVVDLLVSNFRLVETTLDFANIFFHDFQQIKLVTSLKSHNSLSMLRGNVEIEIVLTSHVARNISSIMDQYCTPMLATF